MAFVLLLAIASLISMIAGFATLGSDMKLKSWAYIIGGFCMGFLALFLVASTFINP